MNDNIKNLWNTLRSNGYNPPELDVFANDMQNEENLKRAYATLIRSGYNPPEFDTFKSDMAYKPAPVEQPATAVEPAKTESEEQKSLVNPVNTVDSTNVSVADSIGGEDIAKHEDPKQVESVQQPMKPLGEQYDWAGFTPESQQFQTVPMMEMENTMNADGSMTQRPKLVPTVGDDGRIGVGYRNTMTGEYYDKDSEIGEYENTIQPVMDYEAMNREQVSGLGAKIDEMIEGIKSQHVRSTPMQMRSKDGWLDPIKETDEDRQAQADVLHLESAKRSLKDANRIISEADHNAESGTFLKWLESSFAGGAVRGFGQKMFDPETWLSGTTDLADATMLRDALVKSDKGEKLTDAEQAILDAKAVDLATNAYFGSYVGRGYKAGEVTGESLPFMLEMCVNPASAVGETTQAMLTRYALKRFGSEATEMGLKQFAKTYGKKEAAKVVAGRLAGDVAGSALMSATSGIARVGADAVDRMNGDVLFDTNEEGESVFAGHTEGDSMGEAFAKAFANTTIENYSEMVGEYFAPITGAIGKMATKAMDKIGLKGVNEFIENVATSDVAKMIGDFEKHSKWNGVFGEYAEEVAGNMMNALVVGDMTMDTAEDTGVFNLDQNIDTFLGVSLMGGFMSGAKTLGYRTPKYRAREDMTASDDKAASVFNDQDTWGAIRNSIAFGSDEDAQQTIAEVLTSDTYTDAQKSATLQYAKDVETYKGILQGEKKRRSEAVATDPEDVQVDVETSYDNGYTLNSQQEQNDAKNMYEAKRQGIADLPGGDRLLEKIDADPIAYLSEMQGNSTNNIGVGTHFWVDDDLYQVVAEREDGLVGAVNVNDKQSPVVYMPKSNVAKQKYNNDFRQEVLDYVNAKATYDGMLDAVRDDLTGKIKASNNAIDSHTNLQSGMIIPATMKMGDRKVYVVDGNVAMHEDGTMVDVANSSESVLVRDAETGKLEWASPHDILSVDESIDPYEEKDRQRKLIQDQVAQQAADKIDGKISTEIGSVIPIIGENQQEQNVTILADNGDGTAMIAINGTPMKEPVSIDLIQQQHDNYNLARLAKYEQEKTQQREQKKAEEKERTRPQYNTGDVVTLRLPSGTVITGQVSEELDEDGNVEIYTEVPMVDGQPFDKFHKYNRDELDGMLLTKDGAPVENAQQGEPEADASGTGTTEEANTDATTTGTPVADATGTGTMEADAGTTDAGTTEEGTTEGSAVEQEQVEEPMPMTGEGEDAEPDFAQVTPQRAHKFIFEESGLDEENAKAYMDNNVSASQKELEKLQGKKPKMGTSFAKFNKDTAEWNRKVAEAQQKADYWKQVKAEHDAVLTKQNEQRAEEERLAVEKAKAEEEAYRQEQARLQAEREQNGTNNVSPAIRDKWNNATKIDGAEDEIVLPNGEKVKGHYVLAESGTATPSHDINNGFAETEGFPVDENGNNVNTRDYKGDTDAQNVTRTMAGNYDSRAVQSPVVVSEDAGIVLSGNGRTMAGELAATNGTDGAYNQYVADHAGKYGFTTEQVQGMSHPRVYFVPDGAMPYTAETFDKFNQQETKSQNKTEQAVKLGKTVSDEAFGRIINIINRFDTLAEFYADSKATAEAIGELQKDGIINQAQFAELFDGDGISAIGKELLENTLIGKAFESNPNAVREISEFRSMRQSIITALAEISNNIALGKDYSLESELAQAIDLVYQARKNGSKAGEKVSWYARQQNLDFFGLNETVADYTNATVMMMADAINDNRTTQLKKVMHSYNVNAQQSANGQTDIFAGGVKTKDDIINDVNSILGNGKEKETKPAEAERKEDSVQEDGTDGTGNEGEQVDTENAELSHDMLYEFMRQFLFESDGDMRLLDLISDDDIKMLLDVYESWEKVNDNLGAVHTANDRFVNDKNASIANKAKEAIKAAEYASEKAFMPVQDVYHDLLEKYGIEDDMELVDAIAQAEAEVDEKPTDAQKEAGNYKKGHVKVDGYNITIENPKGSTRSGKDADGKEWSVTMNNTYGYIRGTEGVDGDHIDVFLSDNPTTGNVFVVDQINADGTFDEHKVMYGFANAEEAKQNYLANYSEGWTGLGSITEVTKEEFKKWIESSHRKTKPFAEYKNVKSETPKFEDEQNTAEETQTERKEYADNEEEAKTYAIEDNPVEVDSETFNKFTGLFEKQMQLGKPRTEVKPYGYTETINRHKSNSYTKKAIDEIGDKFGDQFVKNGSSRHLYYYDKETDTMYDLIFEGAVHNGENDYVNLLKIENYSKSYLKAEQSNIQEPVMKATGEDGYSVGKAEYTTKRGKKLQMSVVKFGADLSKEQMNAAKSLAKELKGWWSKEHGGFLMRDDESARKLAETILGNEEQVMDEQPVSLEDVKAVNGKEALVNSMEDRTVEEEEDVFGNITAQLSGSQYAMLQNQAEREVRKYESKRKQWEADQAYVHYAIPKKENEIAESEKLVERLTKRLAETKELFEGSLEPVITINGKKYANVGEMADFLTEQNKKVKETEDKLRNMPGEQQSVRTIDIQVGKATFTIKTVQSKRIAEGEGELFTKVSREVFYSCPELGYEDSIVSGGYFKNAVESILKFAVPTEGLEKRIEEEKADIERQKSELELVKARNGKEFEYAEELKTAQEKLEEYTELMMKELAEKEAKYAEMDKEVKTADNVGEAEEASEDAEMQVGEDEPYTAVVTPEAELANEAITLALSENAGIRVVDEEEPNSAQVAEYMAVNEKFNEELDNFNSLPEGHRFELGMPSPKLLAAGFGNLPIVMRASLVSKKKNDPLHTFNPSDLKDMVEALQNPIAVLKYSKDNMRNVIVDITKNGKHFLVGITLNFKGANSVLEVNSVSGLFPKDNHEWIKWIQDGKAIAIYEKDKVQNLIDSLRINPAEAERIGLNLNYVAKVLNEFENPPIPSVNNSENAEFMTVWHGSAAIFDAFDSNYFLSGEGSMVYGDGHYVSNVRGTGEMYAGIAIRTRSMNKKFVGTNPLNASQRAIEWAEYWVEQYGFYGAKDHARNAFADRTLSKEAEEGAIFMMSCQPKDFGFDTVPKRQLYRVEVPDDNGSNYILWTDMFNTKTAQEVADKMDAEGLMLDIVDGSKVKAGEYLMEHLSGRGLFYELEAMTGSSRGVSKLLSHLGYVGFKVPTGMQRGGDGRGMNYVIFKDSDLKIQERIEFMEKPNGTVYGWAEGNTIHLTKAGNNPNSKIHEYTHLWAKAVKAKNPELWKRVVELMAQTDEWNEVVNDPAYNLTSNDAIASEVLSRLSGRNGAKKMTEMAKKMIDEANGVFEKAKATDLISRVKQVISDFWKWVGQNLFNMKDFKSADEVTDRVLFDLLNKTELGLDVDSQGGAEFQVVTDKQTKEWFEKQPKVVTFKTVATTKDGGMSAPMASKVKSSVADQTVVGKNGKARKAKETVETGKYEFGKLLVAEENPSLIKRTKSETRTDENGKDYEHQYGEIEIVREDGKSLVVAYDPYDHSSDSMINDQFKSAWERDNLIVIRQEIAQTDLDEKYQADNAYLPTGKHNWKTGVLGRAMENEDARHVYLARYSRPLEQVSWDEVAQEWIDKCKKYGLDVPFNIVPKAIREKLVDAGVNIVAPENGMGQNCFDAYEEWKQERLRYREKEGFEDGTVLPIMRNADGSVSVEGLAGSFADEAQKLGLDVDVLTSTEGLKGRQANAKGWFDPKTGKIVIVLPNHSSRQDVMRTLLHEGVAHYGLRKLFGEDFDTFLDNVFDNATQDIRRQIVNLAVKHNWTFRTATEEYLASLAEDTRFENAMKEGWWAKIKNFFLKALRAKGIMLFDALTDNELRYVLWRSYDNLANRNHGAIRQAENVVMEQKLGVGNYQQPNSAVGKVADNPFVMKRKAKELANIFNTLALDELPFSVQEYLENNEALNELVFPADDVDAAYDYLNSIDANEYENVTRGRWYYPIPSYYEFKSMDEDDAKAEVEMFMEHVRNNALDLILTNSAWLEDNMPELVESIKFNDEILSQEEVRRSLGFDENAGIMTGNVEIDEDKLEELVSKKNGMYVGENSPEDSDYLYRDGDAMENVDRVIVADKYEREVQSGMYQFREAVQDSMLSLRRLMEMVAKATGKKVRDYENAYYAENALSSKNHAEQDLYGKMLFRPLLDEIHRIAKEENSSRDEVTRYMMAKHGLERNEVMAKRQAERDAEKELGKDLREAEKAFQADPLDQDLADAYDALKQAMQDRKEALYETYREKDFGGITGLMEEDDIAVAEALADKFVKDFEQNHFVDNLWSLTNACTKATLDKTYKGGLLSKAVYDDINSMYKYYIPLRGYDETTSDEVYSYLTHEKSGFASVMKKAKGRKSVADDPIATIANMADNAIVQGNRNLMKQKFLKFAMDNPTDLISVSKMWLKYDDVTDQWEVVSAQIDENDTPEQILAKTEAFEQQMQILAEAMPDKYKQGKDAADLPYKALGKALNEHQVHVKFMGEDYILTVNGSPRVAQALNGLTNPDSDVAGAVGAILKAGEFVNRQMSAFYTTRNPEFVLSNFIRDALYANTTMWVKESPKYAWKFNKNFKNVNPAKLYSLIKKHNTGTLDMNDEVEKAFYQFMMNGGETGYTVVKDIEKQKKLIKKYVRMKDSTVPVELAWEWLGQKLDDINRSVENCARFAAFLTSRQEGRSIERSINDAKEVSVNFNKKGAGSTFMGKKDQTKFGNLGAFTSGLGRTFYVFWNAAVQGTTNFASLHKHHTGKALAMDASLFLLGAVLAGIGGGDDDDYYNLPDYVRRSNICFKIPKTNVFASLPLGIEQRAIYGMGELFSSIASGRERMSAMEISKAIAGTLSSLLPLDLMEGSGDVNKATVAPSWAKPFVEAETNKDWKGLPIYKDTPFNKEDPEWTKASKKTNKLLVDFSKWCSELTGGDEVKRGRWEWNPSKVEHVVEGTFGGVATTVNKLWKAGETVAGAQDFDWRNILIASRLVKSDSADQEERRVNSEYWKYYNEYNKTKGIVNGYASKIAEGDEKYEGKLQEMYDKPEYGRYQIVDGYDRRIKKVNEELKEGVEGEERKTLEQKLYKLKKEMIEKIRTYDKNPGTLDEVDASYVKYGNMTKPVKKQLDAIRSDKYNDMNKYAEEIGKIAGTPEYQQYTIYNRYKTNIDKLLTMAALTEDEKRRRQLNESAKELKRQLVNILDGLNQQAQ